GVVAIEVPQVVKDGITMGIKSGRIAWDDLILNANNQEIMMDLNGHEKIATLLGLAEENMFSSPLSLIKNTIQLYKTRKLPSDDVLLRRRSEREKILNVYVEAYHLVLLRTLELNHEISVVKQTIANRGQQSFVEKFWFEAKNDALHALFP